MCRQFESFPRMRRQSFEGLASLKVFGHELRHSPAVELLRVKLYRFVSLALDFLQDLADDRLDASEVRFPAFPDLPENQ
jgi:hypothetical protein